MKLRTKASLMVAVVVAVTLTTAEYFFHRDLESSIRQSIHNRVMVVSAAVSDSISHFIEEAHSDCKAIAANIPPEALENRRVDEIERYFKKMLAIYPKFQNGMFLLDTQGGLWADYPAHPQTRGKRFNYREYFKKTMTQARGIIGTPYSSAPHRPAGAYFHGPDHRTRRQYIGAVGLFGAVAFLPRPWAASVT